jgi:type IV pilus assembly protein PilV
MFTQPPHREAAFSLVEAMVSLVVLSVGMIGIAALYGQGLGAGRNALYRTQAVNLAADMADRIRSNRLGLFNYNGAAANNNCDPGGGADCTPDLMAAHDLWVWSTQVANLLPNGAGTVVVANGLPPSYAIRIDWQETGFGVVSHQIVIRVPTL